MPKKVLKDFEIEYLQVLDENGNCDEKLMPKLSNEEIKKIYEMIILIRVFDQKAFNMQRQGRLGTYIQFKGQEASQVGSAMALKDDDFVFPMYRSSGLLIARKHPIVQVLQYWNGDERGLKSPDNVNNFPISIPVGTHMIHSAGAAWAAKLRGTKQISISYFGDGATSKGDFHEAMNFAGVFNVPAVFLCENNQFAISVHRKDQTKSETIAQKAIAYGFEGIQVDGMDVFAVYKATKDAVDKARAGKGPTLIECVTYRMADHSTSDDASRYRTKEEVQAWQKKDPVERLEKYMRKKNLLDDAYKEKILKQSKETIEKAVTQFEKLEAPDPKDMFNYVFAEMTPQQKEEMEELLGK
ncbi:pyruvate dehydrogenase (acetyl-transferring) E1 component subunit alpha [Candidatus Woesearchaeota archaeon]|jgi:pyruvate dehydrogenase E1 component alpha subunit|nr:pyruvate dehydrogenase (acetyl-transferring) E1 component subunit alpha [Candidatus Woesearchaeota archaeon]|tara:strand:+ start:18329 stop:19393 length:1065 start_codon:yes stop_codon:yes gene_type:complete